MKTKLTLSLLLATSALFVGCNKDDDSGPTTGNLKGEIHSPYDVNWIYLVSGNDTLFTEPSTTDASFAYESLKPGNYVLSFNVIPTRITPDPIHVTIEKGKTTDVGSISLAPENGYVQFRIGNDISSGTPTFNSTGSQFGTMTIINSHGTMLMHLPEITGIGEYSTTNSVLQVDFTPDDIISPFALGNYSANDSIGSGSIIITEFDPVTKKGSGTLSFMLQANGPGAAGSIDIPDGILYRNRLKN